MDSKYPRDRELVDRILAGDHAAMVTLLLDQCGRTILYLSREYKIEYEDLLGDLYVHLREDGWKRLAQWKGRRLSRRWIEQVAIRLSLDKIRRKYSRCVLLDNQLVSLVEDPSSDGDAARLEARRAEVLRAVDAVEPQGEAPDPHALHYGCGD